MSKRVLVFIIVLLVGGGLGAFYISRRERGLEVETATVSQSDIRIIVSASGEVRAKDQAELKFLSSGKIDGLEVAVGDRIQKGQVAAFLDQRGLRESLLQAQLNLKKAQADLDLAGETRRQFREEHKYDGPSEELFAQFGQYDARVRGAAALVESYNSQAQSAQISLENNVLLSPIAGTVVETNGKVGEVSPSGPVVIVADLSSFVFEVEVDEADIGRIEVGQKVRLDLGAYPGREFSGEVSEIEKQVSLDSAGNKVVRVKIQMQAADESGFKLGLSGDADIIIEEKKDVLTVPLEAVISEGGKIFVSVWDGKNALRRPVELGLESDDTVEVLSGLQAGDKVVISGLEGT